MASAQAVVIHQGRILLLLRGQTAPWAPGRWALPGGHLKAGETPYQGMRRELREETGIDLPYAAWSIPLIDRNSSLFLVAVPTDQVALLDGEHDEFRWINPADLHRYDPAPGVAPLIQAALHLAQLP